MLVQLQSVDGDAELEAQFLLVGDVRGMDQVRVADRHRLQHMAPQQGTRARRGFLHRLTVGRNLVVRHLGALLVDVAVKAPRHEAVAVGVDEVAGYVLAQRGCRCSGQGEVHGSGPPERYFRPADHRTHFQAVTRQKPLGREHVEGVVVVVTLGPATTTFGPLQALHQVVAPPKQRFVRRFEGALTLSALVEATYLVQRPTQAAPQT